MAIILKKFTDGGDKGLLLISHRELHTFEHIRRFAPRSFQKFSNKYNFILHIGGYQENFKCPLWLNHVITSAGNFNKSPVLNGVRYDDLCSRDLLPPMFKYDGQVDRIYDCIYVCNNARFKRARQFFDLAKRMPHRTFVLVLSYGGNDNAGKYDTKLPEEIREYQKYHGENTNLVFFDAKHNNEGYRLSRQDIATLFQKTSIYVHMCRKEGHSRSTAEALSCGCMLGHYRHFQGGATDICSEQNSFKFDTNEDLIQKIDSTLTSDIDYQSNAAGYDKRRTRAFGRFRNILNGLGVSQKEVDQLFVSDLSMVLPGHIRPAYDNARGGMQADIKSGADFKSLCDYADVKALSHELFSLAVMLRSSSGIQRATMALKLNPYVRKLFGKSSRVAKSG